MKDDDRVLSILMWWCWIRLCILCIGLEMPSR